MQQQPWQQSMCTQHHAVPEQRHNWALKDDRGPHAGGPIDRGPSPDRVQGGDHQLCKLGLLLSIWVRPLRHAASPVLPGAGGLADKVLKDGVCF